MCVFVSITVLHLTRICQFYTNIGVLKFLQTVGDKENRNIENRGLRRQPFSRENLGQPDATIFYSKFFTSRQPFSIETR